MAVKDQYKGIVPIPTQDVLDKIKAYYTYDPETGILMSSAPPRKVPRPIKLTTKVGDRSLKVWQIAWYLQSDEWSETWIDHVDGYRTNNSWANLRQCMPGQNSMNQKKANKPNARSQYKGVSKQHDSGSGQWKAEIYTKETGTIRLGRFHTEIDAARAYDAAAMKYHGEWARCNFAGDNCLFPETAREKPSTIDGPTDKDRFWFFVKKNGQVMPHMTTACWEWTGILNRGYGRFTLGGKPVSAHRYSYELVNESIPDEMMVCHACDNPACVNPNHLWLGNNSDNMLDMFEKGRHRILRGEETTFAKLKDLDIPIIRDRNAKGASYEALAMEYGVKAKSIKRICLRETWAHIP